MTKNILSNNKFETLLVSQDQKVLKIVLNRPKVANAMNSVMGRELRDLFLDINRKSAELRCIVLTGTGDRAFCSGADLKERYGMTEEQWMSQHEVFESAVLAIMDCPVPLIGAVNGAAFGGGMELVLACDFAWGSSSARFALTETTLGIIPGLGSTQYLPRAVGTRRAKEIIFSGSTFTLKHFPELSIRINWFRYNGILVNPSRSNGNTFFDLRSQFIFLKLYLSSI